MKIIDCITYFNEPMLFELRLNILEKYVDEFLVCEAKYTHSGEKKNLNFDINKFKNFKNKINYVAVENEPSDLIKTKNFDEQNNSLFRHNAQQRILHQREAIFQQVKKNNSNDWIIYSDSDEIPNLEIYDLKECKKKIVLFNQKLFYYKFCEVFIGVDHQIPVLHPKLHIFPMFHNEIAKVLNVWHVWIPIG